MTWSPLACGIVSGKYDSGIPPYSRASLKVKQRRGLGEGTGRDRHFGGMELLGLDTFPGPLSAERFQAWELGSPSWPDPMSRKADHLWDICQLKKPLTPPLPCSRHKFNTHNLGQGCVFSFRCLLPYRHPYTLLACH